MKIRPNMDTFESHFANPLQALEEKSMREEVRRAIEKACRIYTGPKAGLRPKWKMILYMRFGFPPWGEEKTLDYAGRFINRSRERVRQIEARCLRVLRHPIISRILKPFIQD